MSSPAIGRPASTPVVISQDYYRTTAPVQDHKAEPDKQYCGNYVANPQGKVCSSNAVTPIQTFLPVLKDVTWAIGLVSAIIELLSDDDKIRSTRSEETVLQTIDYNDYLPTTLGSYTLRVAK